MFAIAIIPSVLLALGMTVSPESPRWLVQVLFLMKNLLVFFFFKIVYTILLLLHLQFMMQQSLPSQFLNVLQCSKESYLKLKHR